MDANKITLKLNGTPIHFNVTPDTHERLIDEIKANSKVAPMNNFLVRTVDAESKEALAPFLKNAGLVVEIATKVLEEFTPKLKITVGE